MKRGCGNMQVVERSLEIAMPEQELNAARLDAGMEQGAWQTSGAGTLADHRELTVAHILKISESCHHLLRITEALRDDPTPKAAHRIRRFGNEQK
jgi:hypothetical protein